MTKPASSIPEWRRRLFPALPILALAYGCGTIAGAVLGGHWFVTALLATCIALAARLRGDPRLWLPIAAIALAAAGHARIATIDATPPPPLAAMTEEHDVVGVVRKDAVLSGILQRVDLSVETVDGAAMTGGIRLRLPTIGMPLQAGERIRFTARLDPPGMIEAFDYAEFLRDRDIHLVAAFPRDWERINRVDLGWRGALFELRRNLLSRIERTLPEPHAALAAGVLIGVQGTLPDDLEHALRNTGTTHLVVVSGQNVALLLGIAVAALTPLISRRYAAVLTLALLPGYVVFVSADPPVVRAAIMAVAVVAADVTGRRTPGWLYLGYAVAVMLAIEPRLVRDVAFQLSATATAGITTLAPVMRDAAIARWPRLDTPARTAVVGIAATATGAALAVLPVQVAAFEVIAPWTILANILVAPIYEATVAGAALAALLGGAGPFGALLTVVPGAFIWLVEVLANLPFAQIPVQLPLVIGLIFLGLLGVLTAWLANRRSAGVGLDPGAHSGIATTVALAMVAGGLWWAVLSPTDTHPSITVLDVGQGLAVLVRDGNRTVLLDAGPPDGAVILALSDAGVRNHLDAVVISHPDADHIGGLYPVMRRLSVPAVYLESTAIQHVEPIPGVDGAQPLSIGDRIYVGRVLLEVLAPPVGTRPAAMMSPNDQSLVIRVTVGDRRVLFTGDIERQGESWLVASGQNLRADVIVVPHQGSRTSSSPELLAAVDPLIAVIPVGRNPFGHPHEEVLERYEAIPGLAIYRTDMHGNVTIRTDGDRMWVSHQRE